MLTGIDPNVKKTVVKYNYREGVFRPAPRIDHLAVHFAMDGNLVHISSPEGRALVAKDGSRVSDDPEAFRSAVSQVGDPDLNGSSDLFAEGILIGGDVLSSPTSKPVKNQFNFTERACMTFRPPIRNKAVATAPPPRSDSSGSINQWIIFDTYLKEYNVQLALRDLRDNRKPGKDDGTEGKEEVGQSGAVGDASGKDAQIPASGSTTAGTGSDPAFGATSDPETSLSAAPILAATTPKNSEDILASPALANALKVMERAVNQATTIDSFRDFNFDEIAAMLAVQESLIRNSDLSSNPPPAIAPDGKGVAGSVLAPGRDGLRPLWSFGHDASQSERATRGNSKTSFSSGATSNVSTMTNAQNAYDEVVPASKSNFKKAVTAIAWNPAYPDLFAIGLGSYDYLKQSGGAVCCYSLKNVSYPEAKFKTASGVMSLDWHPNLPSLLVVGLHDGTVCVYDIKNPSSEPIFSSTNPATRHTGPVWQVAWDEDTTVLSFSSLSSDGRYVKWVVNKSDLDQDEVLTIALRQSDVEAANVYEHENDDTFDLSLVTTASGTCFDINPTLNLLVVGTEEGNISTYDISHNSKFAFAFQGHTMSVYSVKWSPFHPSVFLSCSADWTVKLWEFSTRNPIMTFDMHGPVGDVAWSPYKSTVFGCVTQDGAVKIYDLALDKSAPISGDYRPISSPNGRLTHLAFNHKKPVIAVTDQQGGVHVLKLTGRLYKLNALRLEDIDPVLEQDILQKILIIQDEKGNNKVTKTYRTAWAQRKIAERELAAKKAAEANAAKKNVAAEQED